MHPRNVLATVLTLLSGTVSSLSNKLAFQTSSAGVSGHFTLFSKPCLFTVLMFIGEALCLLVVWISRMMDGESRSNIEESRSDIEESRFMHDATEFTNHDSHATENGGHDKKKTKSNGKKNEANHSDSKVLIHYDEKIVTNPDTKKIINLSANQRNEILHDRPDVYFSNHLHESLVWKNEEEWKPKPPIWYYAILCWFDLTATTLNNIGTLWVSASAVQMLRGSSVLFTGLCTILILNKKLSHGQWSGIGVVILALLMVGASQFLDEYYNPSSASTNSDATNSDVMIGIILILLGSFINSVQNVYEEKLLKGGEFRDADPLEVVGWEGVFGTIFSAFILLPIAQALPPISGQNDNGHFEDTYDTFTKLSNSWELVMYCVIYAVALGIMNNYSQVLSKNLSAIVRMLVSTCRVVLVWISGIVIFQFNKSKGETWDDWSWLQLGAFLVLVGGTFIYVRAGTVKQINDEDSIQTTA